MKRLCTWLVAGFTLVAGVAAAQEVQPAKSPTPGEGPRGQLRDDIRAHFQQQREEDMKFHETLRGMTPLAMCAAIKQHREKQHGENVAFFDQEYQRVVELRKKAMADRGMPADEQQRMLARMAERHEKLKARFETLFKEFISKLDDLSRKPDLTVEDLRAEMKAWHEKLKALVEEFRDALQARRDGARGDGPRRPPAQTPAKSSGV